MDLIVFGANGPTGRLVVAQALTAGHHVTAVTRKPGAYPLSSPHLAVIAGDVTDPDEVDRVLATAPQAVISTYGVPFSRNEVTVYSIGVTNIIQAMTTHGVRRLVCVTSTTVGTEKAPPSESLFGRKVLEPFLRNIVGRTLYDDMERMEDLVQGSGLDWTIVRPGGLFDAAEPTIDYEVAPRRLLGNRVTSRADLAETLLREATAAQHPHSIIEVITRSGTPSATTFLKEAFGSRT